MILLISLLSMTITGSIGALLLKLVSLQSTKIKKFYILVMGGIFYLVSSIINIITLKSYDYSIVYPATAIAYIWTMLFGKCFLGESITMNKIIGCFIIIMGIFLLTR